MASERRKRSVKGGALRRKRKASVSKWLGLKSEAHDRKAQELPAHARLSTMEVDDPNPTTGETERIVVVRTISSDPLAWMHAHGYVDDAKFLAGRRWQGLYDKAVMSSLQSVDTSKEPVDGGRWPEMLSDDRALALRELRRIDKALSATRAALVLDVLGRGMYMPQAAALRGVTTDWQRRKWTREFYLSLECMAVEFGFVTPPSRHSEVLLKLPTGVGK